MVERMKEKREEWYGGPYDGTDNPPDDAEGLVYCKETGENIFIFECFDQYHFYKPERKKNQWFWRYAGVCPDHKYKEWKIEFRNRAPDDYGLPEDEDE